MNQFRRTLMELGFKEIGYHKQCGTIILEFRNITLALPPPINGEDYCDDQINSIIGKWFNDTEEPDLLLILQKNELN